LVVLGLVEYDGVVPIPKLAIPKLFKRALKNRY
jgi:hypothetical protein